MVSGNFFSGLGVPAALGKLLTLEDESRHTQVAVLSYNFWTRRFVRNPSALAQCLYIKGVPLRIIAASPRDFFGVKPQGSTQLWIPFQSLPELIPWRVFSSVKT